MNIQPVVSTEVLTVENIKKIFANKGIRETFIEGSYKGKKRLIITTPEGFRSEKVTPENPLLEQEFKNILLSQIAQKKPPPPQNSVLIVKCGSRTSNGKSYINYNVCLIEKNDIYYSVFSLSTQKLNATGMKTNYNLNLGTPKNVSQFKFDPHGSDESFSKTLNKVMAQIHTYKNKPPPTVTNEETATILSSSQVPIGGGKKKRSTKKSTTSKKRVTKKKSTTTKKKSTTTKKKSTITKKKSSTTKKKSTTTKKRVTKKKSTTRK